MNKTVLLCFTVGFYCNGTWAADEKPTSGAQFCEGLEKSTHKHKEGGQSLGAVREALGLEKGALGALAKDSVENFKNVEFIDLIDEDQEWKEDHTAIADEDVPIGAIFVLDRSQDSKCPVNRDAGHVAVKCQPDVLVWFSKGKDAMTISRLAHEFPACIRAIMYNPNWDDETEDKPNVQSEEEKAVDGDQAENDGVENASAPATRHKKAKKRKHKKKPRHEKKRRHSSEGGAKAKPSKRID